MARKKSIKSTINGSTQAYLGNNRSRRIERGAGNRFATHNQNYRLLRKAMGLSAG